MIKNQIWAIKISSKIGHRYNTLLLRSQKIVLIFGKHAISAIPVINYIVTKNLRLNIKISEDKIP